MFKSKNIARAIKEPFILKKQHEYILVLYNDSHKCRCLHNIKYIINSRNQYS